MLVKGVIDEDFVNYKEPAMYIATTKCNFKCCTEAGINICQNMSIIKQPDINIDNNKLIERSLNNPITKAIVFSGHEPFETFDDMYDFIKKLRWDYSCFDPVVIYTGFYPYEIIDKLSCLSKFDKIIIKFGRFLPDQEPHFDEVLGVDLASSNQWAEEL